MGFTVLQLRLQHVLVGHLKANIFKTIHGDWFKVNEYWTTRSRYLLFQNYIVGKLTVGIHRSCGFFGSGYRIIQWIRSLFLEMFLPCSGDHELCRKACLPEDFYASADCAGNIKVTRPISILLDSENVPHAQQLLSGVHLVKK